VCVTLSGFEWLDEIKDLSELDLGAKDLDHWGGCPTCHSYDYFLDDGPDHWFVCNEHVDRLEPVQRLAARSSVENKLVAIVTVPRS
jgi:hypothetical protein